MGRAQQIIDRLIEERRMRRSRTTPLLDASGDSAERGGAMPGVSSSSEEPSRGRVYEDEPILKTGRQLAREMAREAAREMARVAARPEAREAARLEVHVRTRAHAGTRTPEMPQRKESDPRPHVKQEPLDFSAAFSAFDQPLPEGGSCELPPVLLNLRKLERQARELGWTEPRLFVSQAELAADYEDDLPYNGTFMHYFPTYRAMSDVQLRGYFTWRTHVRRGDVRRASLSFAFVYLYELINGIGIADAAGGFRELRRFCAAYRQIDDRIDRYARIWLDDYVIYHGLDAHLLGSYGKPLGETLRSGDAGPSSEDASLAYEDALLLLAREEGEESVPSVEGAVPAAEAAPARGFSPAGAVPPAAEAAPSAGTGAHMPLSDERLAEVLSALASPQLSKSRLYRDDPAALQHVAAGTWRALSAYYRKHRKTTLFRHLFGVKARYAYAMFRSAVFWERYPHPDVVYRASATRCYVCRNGRWQCEQFYRAGERSSELGRVLRAVDGRLRERLDYPHKLKEARVPKYLLAIIDKQIDALLAQRAAEAAAEEQRRAREVHIDFSKLAGIRATAAATREALLVDEEREGAAPMLRSPHDGNAEDVSSNVARTGESSAHAGTPASDALPSGAPTSSSYAAAASGTQAPIAPTDASAQAGGAALLTEDEAAYLACLIAQAPASERAIVLRRAGTTEALMVDALNEKLYDELGDVAVEDGEDGPQVIEDYVEDVKGYAGL